MKKKKDFILSLYQSDSTVFTIGEIALLLGETDRERLKSRINYFVKRGKLKNVRKGIYTKLNYDHLELANKIYTPSYISLETVLAKEGVIFQIYEPIFVVSYLTRKIDVDGYKIQYRRIKEDILINKKGVEIEKYAIASKERAVLDVLYLYREYYFDNLDIINKDKILKLVEIYRSKTLKGKVEDLLENV